MAGEAVVEGLTPRIWGRSRGGTYDGICLRGRGKGVEGEDLAGASEAGVAAAGETENGDERPVFQVAPKAAGGDTTQADDGAMGDRSQGSVASSDEPGLKGGGLAEARGGFGIDGGLQGEGEVRRRSAFRGEEVA